MIASAGTLLGSTSGIPYLSPSFHIHVPFLFPGKCGQSKTPRLSVWQISLVNVTALFGGVFISGVRDGFPDAGAKAMRRKACWHAGLRAIALSLTSSDARLLMHINSAVESLYLSSVYLVSQTELIPPWYQGEMWTQHHQIVINSSRIDKVFVTTVDSASQANYKNAFSETNTASYLPVRRAL